MGEKTFSKKDANVYEGRTVIECPECVFEFSVIHESSDKAGEYTCPNCEELRLSDENKRLREALEFYADEKNHTEPRGTRIFGDVFYDKGKMARQALEGDINA